MFDLAWSEIALIAVVALVVIGPKDLPEAIRGVARGMQKLRRMAGEFQAPGRRAGARGEARRGAPVRSTKSAISTSATSSRRRWTRTAPSAAPYDDPLRDTYTPPTAYTPPPAAPPPWKARRHGGHRRCARRNDGTAAPAFIPPSRRRRGAPACARCPPPFVPPAEAPAAAAELRTAARGGRPQAAAAAAPEATPAVHRSVSSPPCRATTGRRPDRRQADAVDRPPDGAAPAAAVVGRRLRHRLRRLLLLLPQIYGFLAQPLADILREQGGGERRMIFTALYEAFFTYLKVAFFGAAFFSFPMWATQLWLFVAPGLYRSEKRAVTPFLIASPFLFVLGAALAYYFIFPLAWRFFITFETLPGSGGMPIQLEAKVERVPLARHAHDPGLRHRLPAAGAADAALPRRHPERGPAEEGPALRHRRHVRGGGGPHAARHHQPDRPGRAADRALRDLHPRRVLDGAEAGAGRRRPRATDARHPGDPRRPRRLRRRPRAPRPAAASADGAGRGRPPPRRANGAGSPASPPQRPRPRDRPGQAARRRHARRSKPRRRRSAARWRAWRPRPPPPSAPKGRCWKPLPNILDADVPDGPDETANVVLHQHGEPSRFNFPPRQHFEIGEALGLMDFAAAAKLAGSRFTVLRGALARLERALGQWMLDLHTERARLHRSRGAAAGERRRHVRHRPAPEIRRGSLPHHRRPLADPDLRGAARPTSPPARSCPNRRCPSASPPSRPASAPRPAAPGATPAGCCASTSSRRWNSSPSPAPRTARPSTSA